MVEKRWLAGFIVSRALVGLDLFQLHVHSVIPCLCSLQNHRQKVFNWETLRLCRGLTF